ncbi:hypothetical protein BDQ17DRAFT_1212760, partial [Cyathus striatus]
IYHFHTSTAAYTEFWNYTFSNGTENEIPPVSCQQVWKAFIEETTCYISLSTNCDLRIPDRVSTEQVTKAAFDQLGQKGIINNTLQHSCSECTHKYKATADIITADDNAAVVGIDENRHVPDLERNARNQEFQHIEDNEMSVDTSDTTNAIEPMVKMIVVDGIVMGPTHCAFENCSEALKNA